MTTSPLFYYQAKSKLIAGSAADFKWLTKATWLSNMKVDCPAQESFKKSTLDLEMQDYLKPLYQDYIKNPPLLSLYPQRGNAWSLHSYQPIKKGQVVTEYLGEWLPQNTRASSYRFGPIDALNYRNCAAFAEDGFPNMGAFYLYDTQNIPLRVLFIALEDIEAGQALLINYGLTHLVKINHHTEYHLNQMISYFKNHPLEVCFEELKHLSQQSRLKMGFNKSLDHENLTAKLQYLFQTPSAAFHLLLNDLISSESFFKLFDKIDHRFYLLGYSFEYRPKQDEILRQFQLIRKYFERQSRCDNLLGQLLDRYRIRLITHIFLKLFLENHPINQCLSQLEHAEQIFNAICTNNEDQLYDHYLQSECKSILLEQANLFACEIHSQIRIVADNQSNFNCSTLSSN